MLCWEPHKGKLSGFVDAAIRSSGVIGDDRGFIRITPVFGSSCCNITIVQRLENEGHLLLPAVFGGKRSIEDVLSTPNEFINSFNKDRKVDIEERHNLICAMKDPKEELYTEEELDTISSIQKFASDSDKISMQPIDFPEGCKLVRMKLGVGASKTVAYAEVILDASLMECASIEYLANSREGAFDFHESGGGVQLDQWQRDNHSSVKRAVYDFGIKNFD